MNLIAETLRLKGVGVTRPKIEKSGRLDANDLVHVNDFFVASDLFDIHAEVEGLGRVGLTRDGAIRVNSDQFIKISRMGIGDYTSQSLNDGNFLLFPKKK